MLPVLTADALRSAELAHWDEHPGEDLMGRAAAEVARHATEMLGDSRRPVVLVAAGPGSNAGDALHAMALLPPPLGAEVRIWPVRGRTHREGLDAALAAGARVIGFEEAVELLARTDLLVDGVAGLGSRPLEGDAARLARAARAQHVRVLCVDLPSGLRADAADAPEDAFRAERTVTFIAPKLCHVAAPAALLCGDVRLATLEVDPGETSTHQAGASDLPAWYPMPQSSAQKYTRGVIGLETGSARYPGAAVLGAAGALFTGTGMVRHPGEAGAAVVSRFPSVVAAAGRVQAWTCGSGWDVEDPESRAAHRDRLAELIGEGRPMVLDAGALDLIADVPPLPEGCLLSPHAGELARLLGREREDVEADPLGAAREAAARTGASVLLKGTVQAAADPDGRVVLAVRGPAWTAQAGSGDVLAGSAGALLAAGLPASRAGVLAASLQAIAATRSPGPILPDRLARTFPQVIADWEGELVRSGGRSPDERAPRGIRTD